MFSLCFDIESHDMFLIMVVPVDITYTCIVETARMCLSRVFTKSSVSAHPHALSGNTAQAATVALVARNLNDTLTSASAERLHIQMGPLECNPT